jgi:radical SAM-linked protein
VKITYKVLFNKDGWMRFISHLDLLRLFNRALRRSGFSLYLTKGFSPHPVIRIDKALKLGLCGKDLTAELVLGEKTDNENFKNRLSEQLPEGISITSVEVIKEDAGDIS